MEAFSLLRYWRSNSGDATCSSDVTTPTATTIVTSVSTQTSETENEEDDENDHGPFIDLEFSLPAERDENGEQELVNNDDEDEEEDFDGSDESEDDVNVSVSPSDDLFFNGGFVPVDSVEQTEEIRSNPSQFQSRVSLMKLKSATKFRVMMLKFKKSKDEQKKNDENEKTDLNGEDSGKSPAEDAPDDSLFKRRNSSSNKPSKTQQNDNVSVTKEAMQKYLRKVKPLYVLVSKRYGEKLKFTGQLRLPVINKPNPAPSPATEEQMQSTSRNPNRIPKRENESILEVSEPPLLASNVLGLKQGNIPAGLRVVCKHLRKSRSAFAAVAAAPPSTISSNRRDDSLLQQQDGIQSAILHCKRSFKASRDSDCSSSNPAPAVGKCEGSSFSDDVDGEETPEMNKS